ncbi:MAG: transposase zinc-binding domain-containing protein, partial [Pirellulales bacterium]
MTTRMDEQAEATRSPVAKRPRVVNVLRRHLAESLSTLSTRQRRVLQQLHSCRRGGYGSRLHGCDRCDHGHVTLNSCGNRHCPCCGDGRRDGWRERMAEIALDAPYVHVVFTTPHELNDVHDLPGSRALPVSKTQTLSDQLGGRPIKTTSNDSEMIRLLFDSAIAALKKACKERGIEDVGAVMTLHTWGQRMKRHVHLHVVLIAGGVSGAAWVPLPIDDASLLSLRDSLARVYRNAYTDRFRRRVKTGRIRMPGVKLTDEAGQQQATTTLAGKLAKKSWIVDM